MTLKELKEVLDECKLPDETIVTLHTPTGSYFINQLAEDESVDTSMYVPELVIFAGSEWG